MFSSAEETRFPPVPSPDPDFCPPCECPETLAQPRFSSPRSELPPEETERLDACIEVANELLLTLGLPRESSGETDLPAPGGEAANTNATGRRLQVQFRKMRGMLIRAKVDCGNRSLQVLGTIHDAGLNFLQMDTVDSLVLIPYRRLTTITRSRHTLEPEREQQELLNIAAPLRRALVLNFGQVVSGSPELLNLFYGINLSQKFTTLIGSYLHVHTEQRGTIRGTVVGSDDLTVLLQVKKSTISISLDEICSVKIP